MLARFLCLPLPPTMCSLSKNLAKFIGSECCSLKLGNWFGFLGSAWASTVILGGFGSDLHDRPSTNSVLYSDSVGAHFWFATGAIFLEILSAFMRENISKYQARWNVIKPSKLIHRGRALYFANAVITMGTIYNVMKRVDWYWAPVTLDIKNAGRYIYSWAILIGLLFIVKKPVFIFVQGISRPGIPAWYRFIPISIFMLSHITIFIVDISLGKCSWLFEDLYVRWEPPIVVSISFSLLYTLAHLKRFKRMLVAKLMRLVLAGTTLFALLHFGVNFNFIMMSSSIVLGNYQFMIALAKINIAGLGLRSVIENKVIFESKNNHLVPALSALYLLVLGGAGLHILTCILEPISWILRRLMAVSYGLDDEFGIKALTIYYHEAFDMRTGVGNKITIDNCANTKTMTVENFAVAYIQCSARGFSRVKRMAALRILHALLQKNPWNSELWLEVSTSKSVSGSLFNILGYTAPEDSDIRLLAAKIIKTISVSIRIDSTHDVNLISLLLSAQDQTGGSYILQMNEQTNSSVGLEGRRTSNWRVGNIWQHINEVLSIPKNCLRKDEDTLPLLGLQIFLGLAHDMENCRVMIEAKELIPKIINLISDTAQQKVVSSSLMLLQAFAGLQEKIGVSSRQELSKNIFLFDKLEYVFQNRFSDEQLKPAIDIIYYLAADVSNMSEIWRMDGIIIKLIDTFELRHPLLGLAAGRAIAMLTSECPSSGNAIFALLARFEMLIELLMDDAFGVPAANILAGLCAKCQQLWLQQGQYKSLLHVMPQVMDAILDDGPVERMIAMAGLASQILNTFRGNHKEVEVPVLLATKLVNELDKKPCSESPNRRRVLVELTISLIELSPFNAFLFRQQGMVEALSKLENTSYRMENYRLFLGSEGVVLEKGKPLSELATIASMKIGCDEFASGS